MVNWKTIYEGVTIIAPSTYILRDLSAYLANLNVKYPEDVAKKCMHIIKKEGSSTIETKLSSGAKVEIKIYKNRRPTKKQISYSIYYRISPP